MNARHRSLSIADTFVSCGIAGLFLLAGAPSLASEWKMVWHDEFDKDGKPDPANWDYERGFVRNDELQWYQPENATCKGGFLIIEARREQKAHPGYRAGGKGFRGRETIEVTSACLITKGKHELTYGKFEMRARIDTRLGSWPAFWTLGTSIGRVGWPECGEIDIMEYYTGTVLANVCHVLDRRQKWLTTKKPISELGGEAWAKEFHVWTMEWDKERIDLLLDGKLSAHFEVKGDDEAGKENAFRNPHYILLNQAIGGTSGGDPSKLEYPVRLEVDWVRVYQRDGVSMRGAPAKAAFELQGLATKAELVPDGLSASVIHGWMAFESALAAQRRAPCVRDRRRPRLAR